MDIVVNGCLLARGDVVVIDDNFGVRITEIVGAKELMEVLRKKPGCKSPTYKTNCLKERVKRWVKDPGG